MMEHQKGNRDTSMVDLVILFSMPAIIAILCGAIVWFAIDLNARLGH
jgi:hypothetical protein